MSIQDLLNQLNGTPKWASLDAALRPGAYKTIRELADAFQTASASERMSISAQLTEASKYLMAEYSREKAVEGLRSASRDAILQGLVPVVMASGRSDTKTGGMLLALLLHSAERTGVNAFELFAFAADLATNEDSSSQIRNFPHLPVSSRGIARYGFSERRTPDGLTYEDGFEAMNRPRWFDKLIGRKRVSRATVEAGLMQWLTNTAQTDSRPPDEK